MLRELASDIEAARFDDGDRAIELPVKLRVHDSLFVPLAKWPMLVAGNYRCIHDGKPRSIREAVHDDIATSRSVYEWVTSLCRKLGAAEQDLVPFEKYAHAAQSLGSPSSAARALFARARQIERVDLLVQTIAEAQGLHSPAFRDKVAQVNSSNHYTAEPITRERIARLDREAMASTYKQLFSNAANFTFLMVGSFKMEEALPLVTRYVGSLPSQGEATSSVKDVGLKFPAGIERATVTKGREPKVMTQISFFADPPPDANIVTRLSSAADVLEIALRDILREELGETYTVGVGLDQDTFQRGGGNVAVSFTGAPENLQKMTDRVMQEVKRMQKEGPSEDLVNRAKESAMREHETGMRQNGYWLSRLQAARLLGRDPVEHMLGRENRIKSVTRQNVQQAFVEYFPMKRYTIVTLQPEQAGTPKLPTPNFQLQMPIFLGVGR